MRISIFQSTSSSQTTLNLSSLHHNSLAAVLAQTTRTRSSLSNLHASRRCVTCRWLLCIHDSLLDIACQAVKCLVNVDVALGRDLHERYSQFVGECLPLLSRNCSLLFPVTLVTDQNLVDTLGRVLLNVGEPCPNVCGCLLVAVAYFRAFAGSKDSLLKLRSSVTS